MLWLDKVFTDSQFSHHCEQELGFGEVCKTPFSAAVSLLLQILHGQRGGWVLGINVPGIWALCFCYKLLSHEWPLNLYASKCLKLRLPK